VRRVRAVAGSDTQFADPLISASIKPGSLPSRSCSCSTVSWSVSHLSLPEFLGQNPAIRAAGRVYPEMPSLRPAVDTNTIGTCQKCRAPGVRPSTHPSIWTARRTASRQKGAGFLFRLQPGEPCRSKSGRNPAVPKFLTVARLARPRGARSLPSVVLLHQGSPRTQPHPVAVHVSPLPPLPPLSEDHTPQAFLPARSL